MRPTVPSTPADYAALFWTGCLVLVGFGAVCLFFGYRAPAEKAEQASKLIWGGYGCIAAGIAMHDIRSILRRL